MRRLELAERVIELRERAGLTQGEAAKRAGVGVTTWSNIETGTITRPHARTVIKMARALGVDPEGLTAPFGAGPLSPEWARKADPDLLRKMIQDTPSERLREVGADLVAPFYRVRTREDLVEEGPVSRGPNVNAFARAAIISEELARRGEGSLEDHVLSLKRRKDAMTGGDEAVRDQNQSSEREAG